MRKSLGDGVHLGELGLFRNQKKIDREEVVLELGALDYNVDMITGGERFLQRFLTCASDLTIMIG